MSHPLRTRACACVLGSLLLGSVLGCGRDDGPARYDVSGTVTFKGKPVPAGSVVFTPNSQKGNSGPQGAAKIVNGRYSTAQQGRGTVGGPHVVHVIATSSDKPEDAELTAPLAEHIFDWELPQQTANNQDITIP